MTANFRLHAFQQALMNKIILDMYGVIFCSLVKISRKSFSLVSKVETQLLPSLEVSDFAVH